MPSAWWRALAGLLQPSTTVDAEAHRLIVETRDDLLKTQAALIETRKHLIRLQERVLALEAQKRW